MKKQRRSDAARPERFEQAGAAYESGLDREFGRCSIAALFARALAAGIEILRDQDGTLDREEAAAFVVEQTAVIADFGDLDSRADMSEVGDFLEKTISGPDEYDRLVGLLGWTDSLAGYEFPSFVMFPGTCMVHVVCRKGRLATYESGDEARYPYDLEDAGTEVDDPGLRNLRLSAASRFFGLGPGIWVHDAEDLDPELRDMTLTSGEFRGYWSYLSGEDPDELIEEYLDEFAAMLVADGTTDTFNAPVVLAQLIAGRAPATESERQIVWRIWTDRQPM